jgi:pimeloyl-ACP methyl ester carboxylesterase
LAICTGCFIPAGAQVLDDSVQTGRNFEKAAFRFWCPEGLKQIRSILVLVPGSNGDGRNQILDTLWRDLANRNGLALVGCYFTDFRHADPDAELYVKAAEGSGQALLDAIARFGGRSGHPELEEAPLLLWGHSAGGQFNYEFTCWKPSRILGFVVNKGGIYYSAMVPEASRQVPGIFFTGEKDLEYRSDIVKGIFAVNRRFGALWTIAEEPGAGHEVGRTQSLAKAYFGELIHLRLPAGDEAPDSKSGMTELTESSGLVGDPKSHTITPFGEWKKTRYPTAWLPTAGFSEKWLAFIEGRDF